VKHMVKHSLLFVLAALPALAQATEPEMPIIVTAPGGDADGDDAVRLRAADLDMA